MVLEVLWFKKSFMRWLHTEEDPKENFVRFSHQKKTKKKSFVAKNATAGTFCKFL